MSAAPLPSAKPSRATDAVTAADWRRLDEGRRILADGYADQPYILVADNGAWVCVVTIGAQHEGQPGQHVVAMRSTDQGRSWSKPLPLEDPTGPESSYVVQIKLPGGRLVAFYNYNTDNVRSVAADPHVFKGGRCTRVDTLGHFVYRWSDDHGRTWSAQRAEIPQRAMAIDRANRDQGKLLYFWTVGKAVLDGTDCYVPLHKVGDFGVGFIERSEGVLLHSPDLATIADPARARWTTLPDGDAGIGAPAGGGPVAEEQSVVVLSDGTFYTTYRTIAGHPACSTSRDRGHTWTTPDWLRYHDGRAVKHPRAANFVWACGGGRYLYWFHNHGGAALGLRDDRASYAYNFRNPAWLAAGCEVDGPQGRTIRWSQPEVLLWHEDPLLRMSYPDLVGDGGAWFVTETQKTVARVHPIDPGFIAMLFAQCRVPAARSMPRLPMISGGSVALPTVATDQPGGGYTLEMHVRLARLDVGQVLLDGRDADGHGVLVHLHAAGVIELVITGADGLRATWDTDIGLLRADADHHVVAIVDAGPRLMSFVVDGRFCDGGDQRQFGWGRYDRTLGTIPGHARAVAREGLRGLRVHARPLRTAEAVGGWPIPAP